MEKYDDIDHSIHLQTAIRPKLLRKRTCYFVFLLLIGILIVSIVITCIVIVSIREKNSSVVGVLVQVGKFKTLVDPVIYKQLVSFFDKQLDSDHSGSATITEVLQTFDRFDKDENAILTKEEFMEKTSKQLIFVFNIEDLNSDGVITREEIKKVYSLVDIDDNMTVSREEFVLYHELVRKGMDSQSVN